MKDYIIGFCLIAFRLPFFLACLTLAGLFHCLFWPMPSKIQRVFILLTNFVLYRLILLSFGVFFVKSNFKICSKSKKMFPMRSGTIVLSNFISFLDIFYLKYLASPLFLRTYYEKLKGDLDLDPPAECSRLFESLGFLQTFSLAFSQNFVNPKPFNLQTKKLGKLCDIKRNSENYKHGPLVIFNEGKKTNHGKDLPFDDDLMKIVHEEVYKDKSANLDMVRFSYEDNISFPVYSEAHWLTNLFRIMANPYLIIDVTVYNCVFSKKFPMEKERIMHIVSVFYNEKKPNE